MLNFLVSLIKYLTALLEVALTLRLVLKLLAASSYTVAVRGLYGLTDWLIYPFKGIFQNTYFSGNGFLEWSTVAVMIGYGLVAFVLVKLLSLIFED